MSRDEAVVVPEGWLSRGEAFVRGEGTQLAVVGGIPGERVRVRITSRGAHQDRARFISPAGRPHPDRVEPPCDKWSTCGRCSLLHLAPRGRAAMRRDQIGAAFEGAPFPMSEVASSGSGDLHVLELRAGVSDNGRPRLGVVGRERGLVAIPECPATTPTLRALMTVLAHHVIDMRIRPFGHGGPFRGALARQSTATGEVSLTLVFARNVPFARELAERVAGGVMDVRSAHAHWHDGEDGLFGPAPETAPLYGSYTLDEAIGGLKLRVGPLDPWPHAPAAVAAHAAAVDALAVSAGDAVLDLACGVGGRALLAAQRGGGVVGVDGDERALDRARENAATNGLDAIFVDAAPDDALTAVHARLDGRRPLVIADVGTRSTPESKLAELVALSPRRVVLLGTNPRALAHDMRALAHRGLRPVRVDVHDVDPYTPFAQLIGVLEHPDQSPPERRAPRRTRLR